MKQKYKIIVAVVLVIILAMGGLFFSYNNATKAVSKKDESVVFTVSEGMSHDQIVAELSKNGLIKSEIFTQIYLKFNPHPVIQANTYQLNKNMDLETIFTIISTGSYDHIVKNGFTIIEGSTIPQIAEVLATQLGISSDEVLSVWANEDYLKGLIEKYPFLTEDILNPNILYPLEGYLYPQTYDVTHTDQSVEAYTELMLEMSNTIYSPYLKQIEAQGMSIHQFLSFASVVERESLYEADKAKIAGVFYNRLDIDMNLQSDITVLYALQRTGLDISYDDLEVDSLYNTYKYPGLPVGPVSNIYETTLKACLSPEKSDYYYFFACQDGTVLYASTLAEHEKNVEENLWY